MQPERAALFLARIGAVLLLIALGVRGISLVMTLNQQTNASTSPSQTPVMNQYAQSVDGSTLMFFSGTAAGPDTTGRNFLYTIASVEIHPGAFPPTQTAFIIQDGQVRARDSGLTARPPMTPLGMTISNPIFSFDGQRMAFVDDSDPVRLRLYALALNAPLQFTAEESTIREPVFAPELDPEKSDTLDSARLAYLAQREGVEQIMVITFEQGKPQPAVRLTSETDKKCCLSWSPDGQYIAYLRLSDDEDWASSPVYGKSEIYMVRSTGGASIRVTNNNLREIHPTWLLPSTSNAQHKPEILYEVPQPDQPRLHWLYAVEPFEGKPRRIFPPVAIERLGCPEAIGGEKSTRLVISLSNTGSMAQSFPLVVVADRLPADWIALRSSARMRSQMITLEPGEQRVLEWEVPLPGFPHVHVSTFVDIGDAYPYAVANCLVQRRWLMLPRLPMLPLSFGISAAGILLVWPWLRRRDQRMQMIIWGLLAVLIIAPVLIETLLTG